MERGQGSIKLSHRITSDPNICGGEPCVAGTRIPVWVVLSHLAAGEDIDTVLRNFPRLKREDVLACLEYASYLATEKAVPV
ncbi:DUF433 domain-containing protein [Candidatus Bipolaricaulota bacterium]|nr:DUF433 domain-containing protein [Candidatus Bipolaricaulota bacterium]